MARGKKLRVMMVNTHATSGGAARMAATLTRALNEEGTVKATLFHGGDRIRQLPLIGMQRPFSRYLNALLARLGGAQLVLDFGIAKDLARLIEDFDVIHLHNLHGYYLNWEHLFGALQDKPVVWTWHDMWGATGRCGFSFECELWATGCKQCLHLNYYPAAWIDQARWEFETKTQCLKRFKRLIVVTPSEWLREIAIKRGLDPEQVHCVQNPVDVSAYQAMKSIEARNALRLDQKQKYLLFVAADCDNPRKGYADYLKIVEEIGWHGLVAGGKPKELPSYVTYLGQFSDPEKLSVCYSAADALVVPSKFDNYPNTVIESMACGTPVFGYGAGGIPSQMHPRIGAAVNVGDSGAIVNAIKQTLGEGKTAVHRKELREFAMSKWAPREVVEDYMRCYELAASTM